MCHEPHWSSVLQARYSPASAQLWRDQGWVHRFRISVSNSSCLWFPLHPLFILSDSQRSLLLFPWLGKKMLILLILSQPSEVHPSSGQSSRKLQGSWVRETDDFSLVPTNPWSLAAPEQEWGTGEWKQGGGISTKTCPSRSPLATFFSPSKRWVFIFKLSRLSCQSNYRDSPPGCFPV